MIRTSAGTENSSIYHGGVLIHLVQRGVYFCQGEDRLGKQHGSQCQAGDTQAVTFPVSFQFKMGKVLHSFRHLLPGIDSWRQCQTRRINHPDRHKDANADLQYLDYQAATGED